MISADNLASYQDAFAASPINRLMQNAVTESPITKVAMDRSIAVGIDATAWTTGKSPTRRNPAAAGSSPASTPCATPPPNN